MQWSSDLILGVEPIDRQHQEIVERIERLTIALDSHSESVNQARMEEAHKFLEKYVAEHFRDEERQMREANYPDLDDHIALHHAFEAKLVEFKEEIQKSGTITTAAVKLVRFLSDWFVNHIRTVDPKYVPYLRGEM